MAIFVAKCVLFLLTILKVEIQSFNIDVNSPIVKRGPAGSYFGFSLSAHYITDTSSYQILVGAPRANTTGYEQPGAVYRCSVNSQLGDCTQIPFDWTSDSVRSGVAGQWMGVSVASQREGYSIACAHRFRNVVKSSPNLLLALGQCIGLQNDLQEDAALSPCEGKSYSNFKYDVCQSGTSVAVNEADEILIGSPGTWAWSGSLSKNEFQSRLDSDNAWYMMQSTEDGDNVEKATPYYSYLGMSVKIGRFIDGNLTYVGGAPRSKGHGQVILLTIDKKNKTLTARQHLNGRQTGSGFGYDFAIGDFNGDSHDDLVVGAPFYFHRERGISGAIYVYISTSRGRIDNIEPHRIDARSVKPADCEKLRCHDSRFGFSMASAGDLDGDGCHDLVVGAPYEGRGVVYVYSGSRSSIAANVLVLTQTIPASSIGRLAGLSSFGYAISDTRGVDVDGNTYNDILVGAFGSDAAVVLRSRPVVNITSTLSTIPKDINPTLTSCPDGQQNNCFNVTVCMKFTASPADEFLSKLTVKYRLEAEKYRGLAVSRITFRGNNSHVVERQLTLAEQSKDSFQCYTETAYIQKNNKDILNSIYFQLTYSLTSKQPPVMTERGPLTDLFPFPVLRPSRKANEIAVPFVKNCGHDDICHSSLSLQVTVPNLRQDSQGRYVLSAGGAESPLITLSVDVTNTGEDAHAATLTVEFPDALDFIGSDSQAKPYSCTRVDNDDIKAVQCSLGNPLTPNRRISFQLFFQADLTASTSEGNGENSIRVLVNTTSTDTDTTDNVRDVGVNIVYEMYLAIFGSSDPETLLCPDETASEEKPTSVYAIGPLVQHKYEIRNTGQLDMPQFAVSVQWPVRLAGIENGYLLYLVKKPETSGALDIEYCKINSEWIDPENITDVYSERRQRRRSAVEEMQLEKDIDTGSGAATADSLSRKKRSISTHLKCGSHDVSCVTFRCDVPSLPADESILLVFTSRLWNSTISQTYVDEEEVKISSTALLVFDEQSNARKINVNHKQLEVTTTIRFEGVVHGLEIWMIILAILAGLLLLIILIIVLWKVGFFKRSRPNVHQATVQPQRPSKDAEEKLEPSRRSTGEIESDY